MSGSIKRLSGALRRCMIIECGVAELPTLWSVRTQSFPGYMIRCKIVLQPR